MNEPQTHQTSPLDIARLYSCERRGHWAAALRRVLGPVGPKVYELRSTLAVFSELAERPASVIVWQIRDESVTALAEALHKQRRDYASSIGLVVGEKRAARFEWLLREAGAVHAVFTVRNLDQLVRIALRHLSMVPLPPASCEARIEQRLPWPASRSAGFHVKD